jgi:hypothetical protein
VYSGARYIPEQVRSHVKGITKRKMRRNTSRSAGIFGIGYDRTPHTVERVWKVAEEIKYTNDTTKKRKFETPTTLASAGKNTCVKEILE